MNPLVANERFRYFGPDFDGSVIEIQRQMASWSRESGRSNERPHLAARGGHELRQLFCWHPASNHSGRNRLRIRQFDLIVHTLFWLTSHVPPATADCHDSPPGKHWNDPKQIQPGQMPQGQTHVTTSITRDIRLAINRSIATMTLVILTHQPLGKTSSKPDNQNKRPYA